MKGPVHSYVAMPNGKTAYLAELQSGSEVLVVDKHGNTRTVVVGRAKIEARPMILVEASVNGPSHTPPFHLFKGLMSYFFRLMELPIASSCRTLRLSGL